MPEPQGHHGFTFSDISYYVHLAWMTAIGLIWKGKSIGKAVYGAVTVTSRLDDVEARVLKIEQTPQVSRTDIDVLRAELQGTLQSNQSSTLSEIRFLFTGQEDRLGKKYEALDDVIKRLDKKVGP